MMDVQLKPELAIHTTVQGIVNGDHILNGVIALRYVMVVPKTEHGCYNRPH